MLAAIVFDFDGIIVDSEPMHFRAFNEVLAPLQKSIAWEEYCDVYIGLDDRAAFREIFRQHGEAVCPRDLLRMIERKAGIFQTYVQQGEAKPLPGAVELIQSIPARLPTALCSGALRVDIAPILRTLGLQDAFGTMVTAEDTERTGRPPP